MNGHDCVQIKLYLQKQVAHYLKNKKQKQMASPTNCTLKTPALYPNTSDNVLLDKNEELFSFATIPV